MSILRASVTERLDAAGSFRVEVPATDPRVASLQRGHIWRHYREGEGFVFAGLMEEIETLPEGTKMVAIGVITPFMVPLKVTAMVAFSGSAYAVAAARRTLERQRVPRPVTARPAKKSRYFLPVLLPDPGRHRWNGERDENSTASFSSATVNRRRRARMICCRCEFSSRPFGKCLPMTKAWKSNTS